VLVIVTIETKQLPVAPVGWIVVMVVVLVMDRELAEPLAVKFSAAVRTDPWKQLERLLPIGLLKLSLSTPCHGSLVGGGDCFSILLRELCARPGEYPNSWFDPA
jgi:hypothetical protein